MANLRQPPLTPSGFEQAAPRARRWPWLAGLAVGALLVFAWFDGGEEPLRPIAQEVTLPEQAQ